MNLCSARRVLCSCKCSCSNPSLVGNVKGVKKTCSLFFDFWSWRQDCENENGTGLVSSPTNWNSSCALRLFLFPLVLTITVQISAPSLIRAFIRDHMWLLFVTADCIPFNYIGSCSFSPLVKSQTNSKNPCSEFLSLTEHRFDAGLPGFWMMFAMRTAFCSSTPLHKHFVEPTASPCWWDPKSSKKNIFLHLLDGFCDAHCIL